MYGGLIGLGIIALFAMFVIKGAFKIIGQAEVMVVERLGRFNRIARSGLNILIPFLEHPRPIDVRYVESDVSGVKRITAGSTTRIDLREQVFNFPSQPVITKDNVTIDIDAVLYYRIADPQKATYAVQNLPFALETLTRTTLRNIVGEMELDSTLTSRDQINKRMREIIEEASIGWGVDVTRVELQAVVLRIAAIGADSDRTARGIQAHAVHAGIHLLIDEEAIAARADVSNGTQNRER